MRFQAEKKTDYTATFNDCGDSFFPDCAQLVRFLRGTLAESQRRGGTVC